MSEQDKATEENNDISSQTEINSSTVILEGLLRIFGSTLLLITIITILISTVFLLRGDFANHVASGKINLNIFNIDLDIKKFNYVYFKTIGCLLLLNVIFLPIVSRRKLKLVRYVMLIASGICLLFSVEELLILTVFDFNLDSFLTEIILTTSSFFCVFVDIFIMRKKLYDVLNLLGLTALILSVLFN